jgi:dihydroxyacetone kinase-like protein
MSRDALDVPELVVVLTGVCDAMGDSIEDLTHADQAIGDGDHGLAIQRGVQAAKAALEDMPSGDDVGAVLSTFGLAMLNSMGGASGAIFGTLFRGGGSAVRGRDAFDAEALALFLEGGLAGVRERGQASVGDKTLVDALQPAAEAARAAAAGSLASGLAAATAASEEGLERTRGMLATLGRARTLGDRALGHVDPGAMSFALLLGAWARLVRELASIE